MKDIAKYRVVIVEDESVKNSRALSGLLDRLGCELEKRNCRVTRIAGYLEAMPVIGHEMDIDALREILKVEPSYWLEDVASIKELYAKFGTHLPKELADELDRLEANLTK